MSFPNIPNVTPSILVNRSDVVNMLLASIAFEELGLAHVINAEGEKLQAVLGMIPGLSLGATSISQLLSVNQSVNRTLQTVLKTQMLLQFKLDEVMNIPIPSPIVVKQSKIAFTSFRPGANIWVMNADGSNQTNLTNNPNDDFQSTWSPDGSKIAFSSDRSGNSDIWVMNADGSNPTNLTNNSGAGFEYDFPEAKNAMEELGKLVAPDLRFDS